MLVKTYVVSFYSFLTAHFSFSGSVFRFVLILLIRILIQILTLKAENGSGFKFVTFSVSDPKLIRSDLDP